MRGAGSMLGPTLHLLQAWPGSQGKLCCLGQQRSTWKPVVIKVTGIMMRLVDV